MGIIGPTAPSGPAGGSLSGTYPNPGIGESTVGTVQLSPKAVTGPKLAAEAALPAKPAAGSETQQAFTNPVQGITAWFIGNGAQTKLKVTHNFGTELVTITLVEGAAEKPTTKVFGKEGAGAAETEYKVTLTSNTTELTFGAAIANLKELFCTIATG